MGINLEKINKEKLKEFKEPLYFWNGSTELQRTKKALHYSTMVIASYALDIKNSEERVGVDLVEKGFCQGTIYKNAAEDIERILRHGK